MIKSKGWLYVLKSESIPHNIFKIGQTRNWIGENSEGTSHRKVVLQTSLPHYIYPIALYLVSNMDKAEGFLQNVYSENNLQFGGGTEWYFIPQNHLDLIEKYADVDFKSEERLKNFSNVKEQALWLRKHQEKCVVDENFNKLKNAISNLTNRKKLYLKRGQAFCQGVFEDGKFLVLRGSIVADNGIDISKYVKSYNRNPTNINEINYTWKQIIKLCDLDKDGRYILKKDLDISNSGDRNSSMWTQGLLGAPVNWIDEWKYNDFTIRKLRNEKKMDFPSQGKSDKKYRWLR
jgi:hypothetical protein